MTEQADQIGGDAPLAGFLRNQINLRGGLSFAEFMHHCLYHPQYGYYQQPRQRIGKSGDFFTSSSVHALFGRLLARQLIQMAEILAAGEKGEQVFRIVEQGGGVGDLAFDILEAIAVEAPDLYQRLEYVLIEVSADHRQRQAERLAAHLERVCWLGEEEWTLTSGCFLSNELVDAFPVHLVENRGGQLQEVHVVAGGGDAAFSEELRPLSTGKLRDHFAWLGVMPAEGNRAEVNLAAVDWMHRLGQRLQRGFVVTIDYGYPSEELYAPHRRGGTLMCYRRHQADENPYLQPGQKDITAHVDFSALQQAGREVGLSPVWFGEQYRFLLGLGFFEELLRMQNEANSEREAQALRMTLKNLIMPDAGMGETFKVLVQAKDVSADNLHCMRPIRDIPVAGLGLT